jgi:hypothetical protein
MAKFQGGIKFINDGFSKVPSESLNSYIKSFTLGSGETILVGKSDTLDLTITRGTRTSDGEGNALQMQGGQATGTNQVGGDVNIYTGYPTGNAAAGDFKVLGALTNAGSGSAVNPTNDVMLSVSGDTGNVVINGSLTVGSTEVFNSSGVLQVATQGTIDHDSLANFVAAEHYRWDTDISATATINAANIPTLNQNTSGTAAGLSSTLVVGSGGTGATTLASNSILTGNGTSAIQAEAGLIYSSEVLSIGDADGGGAVIRRQTPTDPGTGAEGGDLSIIAGQGIGTNKVGGDLNLYGGASTGAAGGGKIAFFATSGGGGSGSGVVSHVEVGSISSSGALQIDGGITTGSTSFVNSSGVIQVATQGTIDHDSLANFVANEHIDWTGSSAGTIHSTNIPTLNQDTTGNAATATALTSGNKTISGDLTANNIFLPGDGTISFDDSLDGSDQFITGTDSNLTIDGDDKIKLRADTQIEIKSTSNTDTVIITNNSGNIYTAGDIELGHASDTTISRSAAGKVTIEGNEIQTTNYHHHFLNAGFFMSFPFSRYIPLNGSINEQNTSTSSPEYTNFTWPYDGFVKKMILRTETDMGSTELKLYKGASGATVSTAMGAVTQTVDANNAVEFDFTSVTNTYSKGETMAVRVDPTDDPDGGQNITIELVFDLTT